MENRRGENQGLWVRASKGRGSQGLAQHGAGRQHAHTRACTLLSPVCVFFPLQMLFDKSNYANFLPCGLKSVFDTMTWRSHYAYSKQERHPPSCPPTESWLRAESWGGGWSFWVLMILPAHRSGLGVWSVWEGGWRNSLWIKPVPTCHESCSEDAKT